PRLPRWPLVRLRRVTPPPGPPPSRRAEGYPEGTL
ncbi:hypothetical protein BN1708_020463, partial [Verticillium longisporum]